MAQTKKILIAEDDELEQTFIRDGFLKSGKFEISGILPNGYRLLGELEKMNAEALPDVILSDINMPLMTGLEALVKVKKNPALAGIPFVIFSTSAEQTTKDTCMNLGADQFMAKPASFSEYETFARKLHDSIK